MYKYLGSYAFYQRLMGSVQLCMFFAITFVHVILMFQQTHRQSTVFCRYPDEMFGHTNEVELWSCYDSKYILRTGFWTRIHTSKTCLCARDHALKYESNHVHASGRCEMNRCVCVCTRLCDRNRIWECGKLKHRRKNVDYSAKKQSDAWCCILPLKANNIVNKDQRISSAFSHSC